MHQGRSSTGNTPTKTAPASTIDALRASIDRLDRATAELLLRRARVAQRVALLKLLLRLAPRDPARELQVRRNYEEILAPAGWSSDSLDRWLRTMIHVSHDLQAQVRIALQGGPGSWSEESLHRLLPDAQPHRTRSFSDAWRAARQGRAAAAWLPVHNTSTGTLAETQRAHGEADVWLEAAVPIRHALLGPRGLTLARVRRVEGHPRALQQCRRTLDRIVPKAERVATVDGAYSARRLRPGSVTAVLGSPRLANGALRILAPAVADRRDNRTTFQLLVPREAY